MTPVKEAVATQYVVMVAWQCATCDVAGRSVGDVADVVCWNCGGQVIVTAQPSIRVEDL